MKVLFVYNPFSGKALIKNYLYDILQEINTLDVDIVIRPTKRQGDAKEYVLSHQREFDLVICSGGDGTLNEVVSAIMECESEPPMLGYIPSGSTNDFARSLDIPKKMQLAARSIVEGESQKIDIGVFNDRHFTYVAATGAFTEVSYATPQNLKNIWGHQAYIIEGIKQLTSIKAKRMTFMMDDQTYEGEFIFGMISNARSVGGYKGITGKCIRMDDGLFEVTFVKAPASPIQLQQIISSLLLQEYENDMVIHGKARKVKVISEEPIKWVLDGEFGGELKEANISVKPLALNIIIPKM